MFQKIKNFINIRLSKTQILKFVFSSAFGNNKANLELALIGFILILRIPNFILRPSKIEFGDYWTCVQQKIGFSVEFTNFKIYYGNYSNAESDKMISWIYTPPWRKTKIRIFDNKGELFDDFTFVNNILFDSSVSKRIEYLENKLYNLSKFKVPKVQFEFTLEEKGLLLIALTHIEEIEYKLGKGYSSWMSIFSKTRKQKYLKIYINFTSYEINNFTLEMDEHESRECAFKKWAHFNNVKNVHMVNL